MGFWGNSHKAEFLYPRMVNSGCKGPSHSKLNEGFIPFHIPLCGLVVAISLFLGVPMVAGCSSSETAVDTSEVGNVSPEWYNGSVVDFNPAESTVTLILDETEPLEVEFSVEKMSDRYKEFIFSSIKRGDSVSASCLSELVEKGSGINSAINFRIKGLEDQAAKISEEDLSENLADIKANFPA